LRLPVKAIFLVVGRAVNAFTLWKPDPVRVIKGANNIGVYHKTPRSHRKFCKTCGGHLFNQHPHWSLIDVYAAIIRTFPFKANVHVTLPGDPAADARRSPEFQRCAEGNGRDGRNACGRYLGHCRLAPPRGRVACAA
jgi:hypothetical protein